MSWSLVQTAQASSSNANAPITTSAANFSGVDLIVIAVALYLPGQSFYVISDSVGTNNFVNIGSMGGSQGAVGINPAVIMAQCINPSTSTTQTFTFSTIGNPVYCSIAVAGFSGADTGQSAETASNGAANSGSVTSIQTGAVVPPDNGSLIVACASGVTFVSVDSGLSVAVDNVVVPGTSAAINISYLDQSVAASINPQFTYSVASAEAAAIASFKPAGGGGGRTSRLTILGAGYRVKQKPRWERRPSGVYVPRGYGKRAA